jgi:hypothetical protein
MNHTRLAAALGIASLIVTSAAVSAPAAQQVGPASGPADPILVNPSFEDVSDDGNVPGWTPLGAARPGTSFEITTAAAHDGDRSLLLIDDSDTYSIGLESDHFDVEAGAVYTAQAMMDVDRDQLGIYLRYYDSGGNRLTNVASWQGVTEEGEWVAASISAAAPSTAVVGTVVLYSSTTDRGLGYVDSVSVTAGGDVEPPPLRNPTPEEVLEQNPRLSHLGAPVTSKVITNSLLGEEDGTSVVYGTYRGNANSDHPATFVVADADTGDVIRAIPLPGAEGTFETGMASDGRVYIGTNHDYNLWQYDPAAKDVRKIGLINPDSPGDGYAITMTAAEDGAMYIGSYPKGYLYLYDPADDSITNLGAIDPTQAYIRAMAYDFDRQNLYVGVGGSRAQIYKVSSDGATTALLSAESTPGAMDESFINTFTFTDDRLFARGGSSQMLVIKADDTVEYWTNTAREMFGYHVSARPDAAGKYIFTFGTTFWEYDSATQTRRDLGIETNGYLNDSRWVQLEDPEWPGYSMLAATREGTVLMNPTSGRSELRTVEFGNPITVQKILTGPDSMYASGYMIGLTPFDSVTGEAGETLQTGQYESSVVRDGKMLLGTYGYGRVLEYDPASGAAPQQVFSLQHENQDRPFAMDYDEANDRLFVGTVPYYGHNQGALTRYDFNTREKTVYTTEVVTDQSVISVLYHDGLVYVGTTLDGGLGAPPSGQAEARFIVFDPDTGEKVHDFVPVRGDRGVTGLIVGPDGLIWGVSEDTVFKYDPELEEIVYSEKLLGNRYGSSTVWAWAYLKIGSDGNVYGTNRFSFFRLDADTMAYTRLVNGVGNYANVDANGDVLFSAGVHVFKYDVADRQTCETTVTGMHDGPLWVEGGITCVSDATVTGPIMVASNAGVVISDSVVTGPLRSHGATVVTITGTTIDGSVNINGTTSTASISGNDITGPVSFTANSTDAPAVIAGNTIAGPLRCSGNEPPPVHNGDPNTVRGGKRGQCADL